MWLWLALALAQDERRLLAEIESFDVRIDALSAEIASLDGSALDADRRAAEEEARAQAVATQLEAHRGEASGLVRATYHLERQGLLRLLFGAESPWELRRRAHYLEVALRDAASRRAAFANAAAERQARAGAAAASREARDALRASLASRKAEYESQRASRMSLLKRIRGSPQLAMQAEVELDRARQEVDASMAAREGSVREAMPADSAQFRGLQGRLPRPVDGGIARPFGPYVDPVSGKRSNNLGLDFAAPLGTPIRAVAAGTVTRAAYVQGYGMMVVLQHGAYTTLYAHANALRVGEKQVVEAGAVLGLVGNTGLAEDVAARLHFEIRYNNTPQDPAEWLAR